MKLFVFALVVAGASAGCVGPSESPAPTHRWESASAAEVQYRNDHAHCQANAGTAGEREFDTDSDAFAAYKLCMVNRGYELTAYTGHE